MQKKKVVIIQNIIPHYRKEFFEKLKEMLEMSGFEFKLIYGTWEYGINSRKGEIDFSWGTVVESKYYAIGKFGLFWRPCLSHLHNADLVICEQSNKNLIIYYLMIARLFSKMKFAFWGHGRNRQSPVNSFENNFKRLFTKKCDWWFAYTEQVKQELISIGFPENKVTDVQNAIDTTNLVAELKKYENCEAIIKKELNIESNHIAIFCGRLYSNKRINFLLEAAVKIRSRVSDFVLMVVGSGEQEDLLKENIKDKPWIHFYGPKFGVERVKYFRIADLFLMPGLVGLAIVDSFALKTPIVTTNYPFHSPEIGYLKNGFNGLITDNDIISYSYGVADLFNDVQMLEKLKSGCEISRNTYTIDNMVNNFYNGIVKCLQK